MFGIDDIPSAIGSVADLISKGIDKAFPDPMEAAKAKAIILNSETTTYISKIQAETSVMLAEAQSGDKWTSRARPSFLYVMYTFILAAIPYSLIWAFNEPIAQRMTTGVKLWLAAIPPDMWSVFAIGYGGYVVARSSEKSGGLRNLILGERK